MHEKSRRKGTVLKVFVVLAMLFQTYSPTFMMAYESFEMLSTSEETQALELDFGDYDTPVAHLEEGLLELEDLQAHQMDVLSDLEFGSRDFDFMFNQILITQNEIDQVNRQMNDIWLNSAEFLDDDDDGEYDEYGEYHGTVDYHYGDDAPLDDWEDVDMDAFWEGYEPFNPYYDAPPTPMSEEEIREYAQAPIGFDANGNEVEIIEISTYRQLRAFLMGGMGPNDGHFMLTNDITITTGTADTTVVNQTSPFGLHTTQFATPGRPGVFTGIFDGNGHTITNLRLRNANNFNASQTTTMNTHGTAYMAPGQLAFPAQGNGAQGIGFVQQAGHGAVIRNVTFSNAGDTEHTRAVNMPTGATDLAIHRGIGIVIGATQPNPAGGASVITVDHVNISNEGDWPTTLLLDGAQNGPVATSNAQWGGIAGRVNAGSTLNVSHINLNRVEFMAFRRAESVMFGSTNAVRMHAAGGVVGGINGGTLNVTNSITGQNIVDITALADDGGSFWASLVPGRDSQIHANLWETSGANHMGGVVGLVASGHANIEDTEIRSTLAPTDHPIRGRFQVGGAVGGANVQGTIHLNRVTNRANIEVQSYGLDPIHTNGVVGGLIGRAMGAVTVRDSVNYGQVTHHGGTQTGHPANLQHAVVGGILGYSGPSSRLFISEVENHGHLRHANRTSSNILGTTRFSNNPNNVTHNNTSANMGGIVGRTRGSVAIENATNYGHVNKQAAANNTLVQNNTRVGGIIGRMNPVGGQNAHLNSVQNFGAVNIGTAATPINRGSIGGIVGEIMNPARGLANTMILDAENHGMISGGREIGGIVGWSRPRAVFLWDATNHGNIVTTMAANLTNSAVDAGGIVGRSGGAELWIAQVWNHGHVTDVNAAGAAQGDAMQGSQHAGGIVGRSLGIGFRATNAHNTGNVRGRDHAGGIVGFANSNDSNVNLATNRGHIYSSRAGGGLLNVNSVNAAGGIVGRSSRRNMVIRNVGNFGSVRMRGDNGSNDGVGGILGRSHGVNTRVEIAFNHGTISGRNSAGGIVGRNQGALNITDVYNTGQVTGQLDAAGNRVTAGTNGARDVRAGNGILGRRRTGAVRITRAFSAGRVGGYAIATSQSGRGVQNANGSTRGITFNNVFVDSSTFNTIGTGFQDRNPATQVNRHGVFVVDTELLTSGFIPGFNGGAWLTGLQDAHMDDFRTYPYFNWQLVQGGWGEGGEEDGGVAGLRRAHPFFSSIRAYNTVRGERIPRPVMDMVGIDSPVQFGLHGEEPVWIFNTYNNQAGNAMIGRTEPEVIAAGVTSHERLITHNNEMSVGLINQSGVVGFETREVRGRIVVRGYDPLFSNAFENYYIEHTRFEIVSEGYGVGPDGVDLNRLFYGCLIEPPMNAQGDQLDCPEGMTGDTMRGLGLIRFPVDPDEPEIILYGLAPVEDIAVRNNPSTAEDVATAMDRYTIVRITALGYEPAYRIIYRDDLNHLSVGTISVPMTRTEFPIRVWVPQIAEDTPSEDDNAGYADGDEQILPVGPPGTSTLEYTLRQTRPGFGALPGHTYGSALAAYPSVRFERNWDNLTVDQIAEYNEWYDRWIMMTPEERAACRSEDNPDGTLDCEPPFSRIWDYEFGDTIEPDPIIPGVNGHFAIENVMWGDMISATARMHTINTVEQLRFGMLIDRGVTERTAPEYARVLDLDMYVENIALDTIYFRFVEFTGQYDAYGQPIYRNLTIDGSGGTEANPMPVLDWEMEDGDGNIIRCFEIDNTPHRPAQIRSCPEGDQSPPVTVPGNAEGEYVDMYCDGIHYPRPPRATYHPRFPGDPSGNGDGALNAAHQQDMEFVRGDIPHFVVDGIAEDPTVDGASEHTTFFVTDLSGEFLPIEGVPVSHFFEWVSPAVDEEGRAFTLTSTPGLFPSSAAHITHRQGLIDDANSGDPILRRTLTIPLQRIREEEVRIVEVDPSEPNGRRIIEESSLIHNGVELVAIDGAPGTFMMTDAGFNEFYASAYDYISREVVADTESLDALLCLEETINVETGTTTCALRGEYIPIYLDRVADPDEVRAEFVLNPIYDSPNEYEGGYWGQFDDQIVPFEDYFIDPADPIYGLGPAPLREGYRFVGWERRLPTGRYTEWEFNPDTGLWDPPVMIYDHVSWTFDTPATRHVRLYPVWQEALISFEFDWQLTGVTNPGGTVQEGQTPVAPEASEIPENPGATFIGWEPVVGPIFENTIFRAQWQRNADVTVTFDPIGYGASLDGSFVNMTETGTRAFPSGMSLAMNNMDLPQVENPGYTFLGWLTEFQTEFTVDQVVTQNMTVSAVWELNDTVRIAFDPTATGTFPDLPVGEMILMDIIQGLSVMDHATYFDGEIFPANPVRPGDTFVGWELVVPQFDENGYRLLDENDAYVYDIIDFDANKPVPVFAHHVDQLYAVAQWRRNDHIIVTFDANEGVLADINDGTRQLTGGLTLVQAGLEMPANPNRAGYVFSGWYTAQDATGGTVFNANSATPLTNLTVYARWISAEEVMVTFDPGVGLIDGVTGTVNRGVRPGLTVTPGEMPPVPTRIGYTFGGWFAEGATDAFDGDTVVTAAITVFARWNANALVDVTFDLQGGNIAGNADDVVVSVQRELSVGEARMPENPVRTGHTFNGWLIEGTNTVFTPAMPINEAMTVVASWNIDTFNVSHAVTAGEGTVNATVDELTITNPATLNWFAEVIFTATPASGYEFAGWTVNGTAIGEEPLTLNAWVAQVESNEAITLPITIIENTHVTAAFVAIYVDYTFNFGPAFATYNTTGEVRYNVTPINVPTEVPVNIGYRFDGWNPVVGAITTNTTFNAVWTPVTVNYTFDWNVEYLTDVTGTVGYNGTPNAPEIPSRPGYTFVGWTPNVGPITENTTFVATWTGHDEVAVTFDLNGGNIADVTDDVIRTLRGGQTVGTNMPAEPSRVGYAFAGWQISDSETAFTGATVVTENITVVAQWTPNADVTVIFDANGGVLTGASSVEVQGGLSLGTEMPTAPTRVGYVFAGWTIQGTETVFTSTTPVLEDITVVAQWTANANVTVTFDANGGTLTGASSVEVQGGLSLGTEMPTAPTRDGFTFVGWFTVSAATGGYEFTNTTPVEENITVFARWTDNDLATVTFNPGLGSIEGYVANATRSVAEGLTIGENMPPVPTRVGYTFAGWYAEGSEVAFTGSTVVTGNLEVHASWTANANVTVTFNANGGDLTGASSVEVQRELSLGTLMPTDPTRTGHTFAGWQTADGVAFTQATPVNGDVTVYAQWTPIMVPVSHEVVAGAGTVIATLNGETLTNPASVAYGSDVVFTATPAEGYTFDSWSVNNEAEIVEPIGFFQRIINFFITPVETENNPLILTVENVTEVTHVEASFAQIPTIDVDVDEETGDVDIDIHFPGIDDEDIEIETDDDGNIVITVPELDDDQEVLIDLPAGWEYDRDGEVITITPPPGQAVTGPDSDGNFTVDPVPPVIEVDEEDGEVNIDVTLPGDLEDADYDISVDEDGNIVINIPGLGPDREIEIELPNGWEYDREGDHIIITPPPGYEVIEYPPGSGNLVVRPIPPMIDVEVDEDGEVNIEIDIPGVDDVDYDVEIDEDGNIVITFPDTEIDEENSPVINLPPGWDYEVDYENDRIIITPPPGVIIDRDEDENGDEILVVRPVPPIIDVEVDEDGEVTIEVEIPGVDDVDYDVEIDEDGNIVITFPDTGIDEENSPVINLPPGWDYEVDYENDRIIITPPPGYEVIEYPPGSGNLVVRPIPPTIDIDEEDGDITIDINIPGVDEDDIDIEVEDGNIVITLPPGTDIDEDDMTLPGHPDSDWTVEIEIDEDDNIVIIITPPPGSNVNNEGDEDDPILVLVPELPEHVEPEDIPMLPTIPPTIDIDEEDGNIDIDINIPGIDEDDIDIEVEDGNIVITLPPGVEIDEDDITLPGHPDSDWTVEIEVDEDDNIVITITPPEGEEVVIEETPDGPVLVVRPEFPTDGIEPEEMPQAPTVTPEIDIEIDEEGNVDIDVNIPGVDEDDVTVETDSDGNIVITIPNPDGVVDPEGDIDLDLPADWDYEIIEDEDGNIVIIITPPVTTPPPSIEIDEEDGDITIDINIPGVDEDDIDIDVEDGNIIITLPPNTDIDEEYITLPGPDWSVEIDEDEDGNTIIIITPPTDYDVIEDDDQITVIVRPPATVLIDFSVVNGHGGTLTAYVEDVNVLANSQILLGSDIRFVATPNEGYQVRAWRINDVELAVRSTVDTRMIHQISVDTYVTVEFIQVLEEVPPTIDIDEENGDITVDISIPGVDEDDIDIEVEDGNLIITLPPGVDIDEEHISLPGPDWSVDIDVDDDGNTVITITPPPGSNINNEGDEDDPIFVLVPEMPEVVEPEEIPELPACDEGEFMNDEGYCESDEVFYDLNPEGMTPEMIPNKPEVGGVTPEVRPPVTPEIVQPEKEETPEKLPQTGTALGIPTAAIGIIALVAAALLAVIKKREKGEE